MTSKGIISIILGFVGVIFSRFFQGDGTLFKVAIGILGAGVIEFLAYLFDNRKQWDMIKLQIMHPFRQMRLTVAYLFRIETAGKYLLIRRHKKDGNAGFQPVGGVYKYWRGEARDKFQELGIEPCNKIAGDEESENDLRVTIRRRRNLYKFLKWFSSRKDREIDPLREFDEELLQSGLLPKELFKHIKYAYLGKHQEFAIPSPAFNVDEFRYADIFEIKLESEGQKKAIQDLINQQDIIFASAEEIRKGRTQDGKVILPHSFKILPNDNN